MTSHVENDIPHRTNRRPRQAMTARESNAFNEMFSLIFDAAATQEHNNTSGDSIVGIGKDGINDLIGKLRKHPKRLKWSTEMDDVLDRQKEVINLFTTDQELLEWATEAVFGESQRYEAAARKAISEAAMSGVKGDLPMLQPPTYPHLVALVMQTFREKFNDPHLALSIFEHARNLSIASYVFGCSSQAYHQLIETRWKCFQDLKGVLEALKEMQVNGVKVSGQTRRLVEKLRREIGDKHLWAEESEVGTSEIWNILAQIEGITLGREWGNAAHEGNTCLGDVKWDEWKVLDSRDKGQDDWGFDQWDSSYRQGSAGGRRFGRGRKFAKGSESFEDEFLRDGKVAVQRGFLGGKTLESGGTFGENGTGAVRGSPQVRGRARRSRGFGLKEDFNYEGEQFYGGDPASGQESGSENMDEWGFDQVDKLLEQKKY
ncbi:hypothetical protein H0H87_004194 [Tephrocybe sp. NHM501043]|nr:hypothetical protein H0H87_004194 [Tephrocybe sp. NHM501043]